VVCSSLSCFKIFCNICPPPVAWALEMRQKFNGQCIISQPSCWMSSIPHYCKGDWLILSCLWEAYCVGMTCCASKCHRLLCCPIKELINFSESSCCGGRNLYSPYSATVSASFGPSHYRPPPASPASTAVIPLLLLLAFLRSLCFAALYFFSLLHDVFTLLALFCLPLPLALLLLSPCPHPAVLCAIISLLFFITCCYFLHSLPPLQHNSLL
jgi:hypothetical protein